MKELLTDLVKLILGTLLVLVAFFAFIAFVELMILGLDYLPHYVGGVGTFLLYVSFFALVFSLIAKIKD